MRSSSSQRPDLKYLLSNEELGMPLKEGVRILYRVSVPRIDLTPCPARGGVNGIWRAGQLAFVVNE
eukprot:11729770-Alexandrium_andersonii.AAC.1